MNGNFRLDLMPIKAVVLVKTESVKRKQFEVKILEGNIIHFRYFRNALIDIEDIKEGFRLYDELVTDTSTVKRLVEMEKFSSVTKDAREFLQENNKPVIAEAMVVPSEGQRLMFSFFFKFRKSDHPLKAFRDVGSALGWLSKV